jgi:hypothetical protein
MKIHRPAKMGIQSASNVFASTSKGTPMKRISLIAAFAATLIAGCAVDPATKEANDGERLSEREVTTGSRLGSKSNSSMVKVNEGSGVGRGVIEQPNTVMNGK